MLEENIRKKFGELITRSHSISHCNEHGQLLNDEQGHSCTAWLASAQNLVNLVLSGSNSTYLNTVNELCKKSPGYTIPNYVSKVSLILEEILIDIDHGLISSIENQAKAIAYDDFLEHAKEYIKQGRSNESGVIAGVAFEDTLRAICRKHSITEKGEKLDTLISALTKTGVINQLKAKRARVAAHVRTKATHAQWDEFELQDVESTVRFTEELIEHFAG